MNVSGNSAVAYNNHNYDNHTVEVLSLVVIFGEEGYLQLVIADKG